MFIRGIEKRWRFEEPAANMGDREKGVWKKKKTEPKNAGLTCKKGSVDEGRVPSGGRAEVKLKKRKREGILTDANMQTP